MNAKISFWKQTPSSKNGYGTGGLSRAEDMNTSQESSKIVDKYKYSHAPETNSNVWILLTSFYIAMQMLQTAFIIQLNCLPKAPIIHPTETKKVTEAWNCEGSKLHSLNFISSL